MSLSDPLMVALLNKLPPTGAEWSLDERCRWLQACEAILNVVYGPVEKIDIATGVIDIPRGGILSEKNFEEIAAGGSDMIAAEPGDLSPPKFETPSDKIVIEPKAPKNVGAAPSKAGRPADLPANLQMAIEAINSLGGKASAPQIREWLRVKYWPGMPLTWTSVLWTFAADGKLARDGINFILPEHAHPPAIAKPAAPAPKPPPPKPAAPPPRAAKPDVGVGFNHNGRSTVLASAREYVLAGKLRAAMGKGHVSEAFLSQSILGMNTENGRDRIKAMALGMNDPLAEVGLIVEHYPGFGLVMKELA